MMIANLRFVVMELKSSSVGLCVSFQPSSTGENGDQGLSQTCGVARGVRVMEGATDGDNQKG